MKMINRVISFILVLLIILNTGVVFATAADYNLGYNAGLADGEANRDNNTSVNSAWIEHKKNLPDEIQVLDDYENGYRDGYAEGIVEAPKFDYAEKLGEALGKIYGARDFQDGRKSNWEKAFPSDKEIRNMFNLSSLDEDYRDSFIDAFEVAFEEAYIEYYEKALFEPAKVTLEQGIKDGEELGELLGASYGYKDYYEDKKNDYTRDLSSDREIISEYSLSNESDEYEEGFLSGFIRMYEEAYNEAFRGANVNDTLRDEEDAISNGQELGSKAGQLQATIDYMQKIPNNWRRSIPSDSAIISEYNLTIQSENYREMFISGFYDGYSEGYNSKYKELSQGKAVEKSVSEIIPLAGASIYSLDNSFNVTIEPGTYYHQVNLSINTSYDVSQPYFTTMIKASDSYRVSILNTSNNLDDKKLIKLSFEYYGDRNKGGIYKLSNGVWEYLPTKIEDNMMTTYIRPSGITSSGDVYSAFMDSNSMILADARGHWANDEINTFVRRGFISGYSDLTFKPDRNISRAEFLNILGRIYNWNTSVFTGSTVGFTDAHLFGSSSGVISYAYGSGYINGYADGTFKPNNLITYSEVEIIMGKILVNSFFRWDDTANNMLYNKKVRSSSFNNMNNKITRAEVVYMLYSIKELKY